MIRIAVSFSLTTLVFTGKSSLHALMFNSARYKEDTFPFPSRKGFELAFKFSAKIQQVKIFDKNERKFYQCDFINNSALLCKAE